MVAVRNMTREEEAQAAVTLAQWEPMVCLIALRLYHVRGGELEDMKQVGRMAVLRAVENHDPERPGAGSLKTTMWTYIHNAIKNWLRDYRDLVHVPIARWREVRVNVVSMAAPLGRNELQWEDVLAAEPAKEETGEDQLELLKRAVASLPEKERMVIERHFLKGHVLREIAVDLGVAHQRVSQIEAKALRLLRKRMQLADKGLGKAAVKKRKG